MGVNAIEKSLNTRIEELEVQTTDFTHKLRDQEALHEGTLYKL